MEIREVFEILDVALVVVEAAVAVLPVAWVLFLLANKMNYIIPTLWNKGIFQFLCLPNIVIVENRTRSIRNLFNAV